MTIRARAKPKYEILQKFERLVTYSNRAAVNMSGLIKPLIAFQFMLSQLARQMVNVKIGQQRNWLKRVQGERIRCLLDMFGGGKEADNSQYFMKPT